MNIGDWTSDRWVTAFTELSEQMLGKSAQEIGEALENNKEEADEIFSKINFEPFIFKLRTKVEFYGVSFANGCFAMVVLMFWFFFSGHFPQQIHCHERLSDRLQGIQ